MEPQLDNLKSVACTFSAYHALKFKVAGRFCPGGPLRPTDPLPLQIQQSFYELFAEAYRAEALELGVPTRSFSSSSFLSFVQGHAAHFPFRKAESWPHGQK